MVIERGDVFWADLADPAGSEPGYDRPVVVVQGNPFNRSKISTVVVVVMTRNPARARNPGNVVLAAKTTGLDDDSIANVSQIVTIDKGALRGERVGRLSDRHLGLVLSGIDVVLGRGP